MNRRLIVLAVVAAFTLSGCGADTSEQVSGNDVTVRMFDNKYEFTEVQIPVGGSVNWLGAGRNPHNAVAADDSWSSEDVFGSLDQFDADEAVITYDKAGEYAFFCTFHGDADGAGMAGTLIVGDGA